MTVTGRGRKWGGNAWGTLAEICGHVFALSSARRAVAVLVVAEEPKDDMRVIVCVAIKVRVPARGLRLERLSE
jgi:hypothetical protein